jgi:hypothetical protein
LSEHAALHDDSLCGTEEISLEQGREMLDKAAREHLNMTGEQFIAAWDEDRIPDPDSLPVQQVANLLSFAR